MRKASRSVLRPLNSFLTSCPPSPKGRIGNSRCATAADRPAENWSYTMPTGIAPASGRCSGRSLLPPWAQRPRCTASPASRGLIRPQGEVQPHRRTHRQQRTNELPRRQAEVDRFLVAANFFVDFDFHVFSPFGQKKSTGNRCFSQPII